MKDYPSDLDPIIHMIPMAVTVQSQGGDVKETGLPGESCQKMVLQTAIWI
jgi:hypothetical protein